MYCNNCGNQTGEHQSFCDKCGTRVGERGMGNHSRTVCVREKSAGIAALLSLLWAGLGQIYTGKVARGLALMAAQIMLAIASAFFVLVGGLFGGIGGAIGSGILFYVAIFVLWAWNIFDAHKQANKYNDSLMNDGRRPW